MENREKSRIFAGILLIISAITHVSQIFFYGTDWHTIGAAIYGSGYAVLGILLIYFREKKIVDLLCIIILTIGGTLGLIRFIIVLTTENIFNVLNLFHIIVDIIVVPICIYSYLKLKEKN